MATHTTTETPAAAGLDGVHQAIAVLIASNGSGVSERELLDTIRALEDTKASALRDPGRPHRPARPDRPRPPRTRPHPRRPTRPRRRRPPRLRPPRVPGQRLPPAGAGARPDRTTPHAGRDARRGRCPSGAPRSSPARPPACPAKTGPSSTPRSAHPTPDGAYPFDTWGDRTLTAETQKAVYALDPQAVVNRRAKAETERHVSIRPAPDTMARISVLVPATQGIAVWATLTRTADQARSTRRPPDPRAGHGRHPRRTHHRPNHRRRRPGHRQPRHLRPSPPRQRTPTRLAPGLRTRPRRHDRPRRRSRHSAASTPPRPPAPWSRWSRSPASSPPDSPGSSSSATAPAAPPTATPPSATATTPPTTPKADPPPAVNGQGLCEHCNHTKQAPGWTARPINGPPGARHTIETVLPTGHTIRTRPHPRCRPPGQPDRSAAPRSKCGRSCSSTPPSLPR